MPWCWQAPTRSMRSATPTASARCASGKLPEGRGWVVSSRNLRPGHRGRRVRARRRARRDRALHTAERHRREQAVRAAPARQLHLRVRLLRPPRLRAWTASRSTRRVATWAASWPVEAPADADLVLGVPDCGMPVGDGLRLRKRHPVFGRHREEPLRWPHVHPAHAGHATAGHPPEAQSAAFRHPRQAPGGHRRLHRARQHVEEAHRDAARRRRHRGAHAHRRAPRSCGRASTASTPTRATS